jgi:hypothetical protein
MSKYAIIEDGKVVNIAKANEALADNWVQSDSAAIGDLYDGTTFTRPPAPPEPIPQVVSRFQARAALYQAGLLEQVETVMADPATDMLAKLAWADAQEFKRSSPTIAAFSQQIGLTDEQIDELFKQAAQIDA